MLTETHWAVIEDVALRMNVRPGAIQKWKERGSIPFRYRHAVIIEAEKYGIQLPDDFVPMPMSVG